MKEASFQACEPETIKALLQSGARQTVCAWRPCQLQMEEQQVGGQQYRLFGPIVYCHPAKQAHQATASAAAEVYCVACA